jgi:hypothetical protein
MYDVRKKIKKKINTSISSRDDPSVRQRWNMVELVQKVSIFNTCYLSQKWRRPCNRAQPHIFLVNRIQATAPLTGQDFGVFFLRGCISLKNRS